MVLPPMVLPKVCSLIIRRMTVYRRCIWVMVLTVVAGCCGGGSTRLIETAGAEFAGEADYARYDQVASTSAGPPE